MTTEHDPAGAPSPSDRLRAGLEAASGDVVGRCLSDREIRGLADESIAETRADLLFVHIATCEPCATKLEDACRAAGDGRLRSLFPWWVRGLGFAAAAVLAIYAVIKINERDRAKQTAEVPAEMLRMIERGRISRAAEWLAARDEELVGYERPSAELGGTAGESTSLEPTSPAFGVRREGPVVFRWRKTGVADVSDVRVVVMWRATSKTTRSGRVEVPVDAATTELRYPDGRPALPRDREARMRWHLEFVVEGEARRSRSYGLFLATAEERARLASRLKAVDVRLAELGAFPQREDVRSVLRANVFEREGYLGEAAAALAGVAPRDDEIARRLARLERVLPPG